MVKSFLKVQVARPNIFGIGYLFAMLSLLASSHIAKSETPLLERTVAISLNQERRPYEDFPAGRIYLLVQSLSC
jgi:hypothetical protein